MCVFVLLRVSFCFQLATSKGLISGDLCYMEEDGTRVDCRSSSNVGSRTCWSGTDNPTLENPRCFYLPSLCRVASGRCGFIQRWWD